jgi:rhomboid family GlyGly-CTERM serine protease
MVSAGARSKLPLASAGLALACIALACGAAMLGNTAADALAYDRQAILSGQIWRLWSGHLVHYSPRHALTDAGVLFLIGLVLEPLVGTRRLCLALGLCASLIALALLACMPNLLQYRGLSGLDMMMAVMALIALWRSDGLSGSWLVVLGAAMLLKTVCEAGGLSPGEATLPQGVVVVWQAHALGAACGIIFSRFSTGK